MSMFLDIYKCEYEYFIVIQDQYKIIGITLTIKRIYDSNNMHSYNIIDKQQYKMNLLQLLCIHEYKSV